ncbi:uncharacterized protein LOC123880522 [Maniola jurtina]|uniref:uncharacterized protein LOC123880522 n=1 Tax=Maniola jurtina TaxID=191418 RepID=UPI001E68A7A2|nr:uncharacterized protein LOC123880522 [Maniola jurtina]
MTAVFRSLILKIAEILTISILTTCYFANGLCKENDDTVANLTGSKEMLIMRATVYQVGILTNRTNETSDLSTGHQEALTIYHNNGSSIDLSKIPAPLMTNVTAEKVVGVAPVSNGSVPWTTLQRLVAAPHLQGSSNGPDSNIRSGKSKREANKTPVEIIKGAAVIPSEAGINSIALPPLLTFNKNFSTIPVPIPNMSVVSYAKVNTLVHSP